MKIIINSTTLVATLNGVPARIWEGVTESGIPVTCYVTRIAIDKDEPRHEEFSNELDEHAPPSPEIATYPLRLIL